VTRGGATESPGGEAAAPRWTAADTASIVDRAIELAGLFEAVYLAYARA
jgi:hypothetical protein